MSAIADGARLAVEVLGRAFLDCRANRSLMAEVATGELSSDAYYRSLLHLTFRLLCASYAENRGLCPPGKAYRLFQLARKGKRARDSDLFQRCRGPLGLQSPGGAEIGDRDFLAAVSALDHDAEIDELSSAYESLLELKPIFTEGQFTLVEAAGAARKTGGSYFTPLALIDALLDSALEPVLEHASRQGDPVAAVLGLRVCDPACGSGTFLVAAARRIGQRLAEVRLEAD